MHLYQGSRIGSKGGGHDKVTSVLGFKVYILHTRIVYKKTIILPEPQFS